MREARQPLGLGIGWRTEIASFVTEHVAGGEPRIGFIEIVAEHVDPAAVHPQLAALAERGLPIVPHGLTLSLGGADPPEPLRLHRLAELATRFSSPIVSEHIAFVRAGGLESGHLLPVPRTRAMLAVLVENVRLAQAELPVPVVLEHVASVFDWPDPELDEADFLVELLERVDCGLLLDVANLYANARNQSFDAIAWLDRVPVERIAYVHVGGGVVHDGVYHDTHSHPVPAGVLELVEELCVRADPPGVMLERDDRFPPPAELEGELRAIEAAMHRGRLGSDASPSKPARPRAAGAP